jgi:oligopeptidase A
MYGDIFTQVTALVLSSLSSQSGEPVPTPSLSPMSPLHKRRCLFIMLGLIASSSIVTLLLWGYKQNINLYYTPSELLSTHLPLGQKLTVGGRVSQIQVQAQTGTIIFQLSDQQSNITVQYRGVLPQLFADGKDSIVIGKLSENNVLLAEQVLAKHDEVYKPRPQLSNKLNNQKQGTSPAMLAPTTTPSIYVTGLPDFINIKPEVLAMQIEHDIAKIWQTIAEITEIHEPNWHNTLAVLQESMQKLQFNWNTLSHCKQVNSTPAIREAYSNTLELMTKFENQYLQHQGMLKLFKQLKNSTEFAQLAPGQQQVINNAIRDAHLAGVELPEAQRLAFQQLSQALSQASNQFSNNVLDATEAWQHWVAPEASASLDGLPAPILAVAKERASKANKAGWILGLDAPSYVAVMTYAKNRQLRETFYEAYNTRATNYNAATAKFDNTPIMHNILKLRQQQAKMLDLPNYAAHSLSTKMAKDPNKVLAFLEDLCNKARPLAEQELQRLAAFKNIKRSDMQPWDLAFYSEEYKQQHYEFNEEQLRPYFHVDNVLRGLFQLVKDLFNLDITAVEAPSFWIEDPAAQLQVFLVQDTESKPRGIFYVDLYARANKASGAWMASLTPRMRTLSNSLQLPVAFLVTNFTPPSTDNPGNLTHNEVVTLFHEFGHTLQHILTTVDYLGVSGTDGVSWDAIELPSQLLENWAWEWSVISKIAQHYQTKEPLPAAVFEKLRAAKNYNIGLFLLRQLQFGLMDMQLHLGTAQPMAEIIANVRDKTALLPLPPYSHFENCFSHIFSGGYAAGYYSYLWAEVLSSDVFAEFSKHGLTDAALGKRLLNTFFEQGGSKEAMQIFVEFMGREPNNQAWLQQHGF